MAKYDCVTRSDGKLECRPLEAAAPNGSILPSTGDQRALRQRTQHDTNRQAEDLQKRGVLPQVSIGACTEQVMPNKVKQTTCRDGTSKVEYPDGRGYVKKPTATGDTKVDTWGPTPADRCSGVVKKDGTYQRSCQDGTSAMSWNSKAGPIEASKGPRVEQNYTKLKMPDGSSVVNFGRGIVMIEQKDGSRYLLPRMNQSPPSLNQLRKRR